MIPTFRKFLTMLSSKVDKVSGKGLSSNDFTDDLKEKLEGISGGATAVSVEEIIVSPTEPTTDRRKVWFQKGKNYINESLLEIKTMQGVTSSIVDGKIVLNGTATGSQCFFIPIYLEKGTYIFSWYGKHVYPYFTFRNKNGGYISNFESSGESQTSNRVLTVTESNDYIVGVNTISGKVYNAENTSFNIQLEEGTKATDYMPHNIENAIYVKNNNGEYEKFIKKEEDKIKEMEDKVDTALYSINMPSLNEVDLNTHFTEIGKMKAVFGHNFVNAPTIQWLAVTSFKMTATYEVQIAYRFSPATIYFRTCINGTWGEWITK